jgi:hypothetical protein
MFFLLFRTASMIHPFFGWELQCLQPHSSEHELKVLSVLLFGLIIFVELREPPNQH